MANPTITSGEMNLVQKELILLDHFRERMLLLDVKMGIYWSFGFVPDSQTVELTVNESPMQTFLSGRGGGWVALIIPCHHSVNETGLEVSVLALVLLR